MTSESSLILALDLGTATSSAALLARVEGRWRLLGSVATPAATPIEPAIDDLVQRVRAGEHALADELGLPRPGHAPGALSAARRIVARSAPAPSLLVLAPTARRLGWLAEAAGSAGWRTRTLPGHGDDELALVRALLDPDLGAVLIGAGEPPAADERRGLTDLLRLVAAVASRRPELRILLAGGASEAVAAMGGAAIAGAVTLPLGDPTDASGRGRSGRSGRASTGGPEGMPHPDQLRDALIGLRPQPDDAREAVARATRSLAEVLDRRIETLEIGADGALRAVAAPTGDGSGDLRRAHVAAAGLLPPDPDEAILRAVIDWSTVPRDRHRLRDRLRDLRRDPWGESAGDGALLRLAMARAAVARLIEATPGLDAGPPDLVIASGGVWASAPGPAVMLALTDAARRSGASQYVHDAARLLGPLGMLEDESERRLLLSDLADDLLVPLGSAIVAGDLARTRHPGMLVVDAPGARTELELPVGGLQLVDLPPGELATATLSFREPVLLGAPGRSFEVEVSGGLGGLLVDLRDIPLHLPDRADRRREILASWQAALWAEGVS